MMSFTQKSWSDVMLKPGTHCFSAAGNFLYARYAACEQTCFEKQRYLIRSLTSLGKQSKKELEEDITLAPPLSAIFSPWS